MIRGLALIRNPVFRAEFRSRTLWVTALALPTASVAFLIAFTAARMSRDFAVAGAGQVVRADFPYEPWLALAGGLLTVWAHWVVPPCILTVVCTSYELRTLTLMVREGYPEELVLRAQVAAGLTPSLLGAAPMLALFPLMAAFSPGYLPYMAAVAVLAVLWTGLTSGVSCWSGVRHNRLPSAAAWAYGLTCLVIPCLIGVLALMVGSGCSAGRSHPEPVFLAGAGLTAGILVTGVAAAFWDTALMRMLPQRRQDLWSGTPVVAREDG